MTGMLVVLCVLLATLDAWLFVLALRHLRELGDAAYHEHETFRAEREEQLEPLRDVGYVHERVLFDLQHRPGVTHIYNFESLIKRGH